RPMLETAAADGRKYTLDLRLKNSQKWIVLSASCREDATDGVIVTGTIQDISDRKLAEAEVQKLSQVARLSTNGIIITDKQKRIVWANQSTEQLTGYTLAEMRGQSPSMFQCEETDKDTLKLIKSGLDRLRPVRTEILNRSRSGRNYWLELHIQPFFDEFGNHEGFLAVEVDTTDRRQYEEDLRNALEREKELSGVRSRFITMTSHEFRTPLTTIHSNLELLVFYLNTLGLNEDEKLKRYVGRISKESDRLTFLMNDILLLGRIDSGKMEFNPVELDAVSVITDSVQHQEFIKNESRKIRFEVDGDPSPVKVDAVIFNHVLSNLFSNALKYSPGAAAPVCKVSFTPGRMELAVRDFGVGIPATDLPHIFESFHRGQNVSTFQGTGLGLQITRQFVEMHGGGISLESEEGKGTMVSVWFPLSGGQAV
ncbi:MAG: ATP-binding protein, partial [Bacteroidota bacterium]